MTTETLSRRDLLALSAAILSSQLFTSAEALAFDRSITGSPIDVSDLAPEIGEAFLKMAPHEADLTTLEQALYFSTRMSAGEIKARVVADIRSDLGASAFELRTFRYRSWVLSRTEGRLCAYRFLAESS